MMNQDSQIIKIMTSMNRCLERMLSLSLELIQKSEAQGCLPDLADFESQRDVILRAIDLYDRKITDVASNLPQSERTPELIQSITLAMNHKIEIVEKIVRADAEIAGKIELAQMNVLKELAQTRKSKEMLGKFKSTWINENGEEVDTTL
jgi:hypothetical protein